MIEYMIRPCTTGAAFEIIIEKKQIEKILKRMQEMKDHIVVRNEFITILQIDDLQISVLDKGKIIIKGEERENVVRKLFHETFLTEE